MNVIDKIILFNKETSKADLIGNRNVVTSLDGYSLDGKIKYNIDSNHMLYLTLDVDLLGNLVNSIPQKGIIKTYANNREDYWIILNIDKDLDSVELSCRHIVTEYMLSTFINDSKPRLLNCNDMLNHLRVNSETYLEGKQFTLDLETYSNLNFKDYKNKNIWRSNFYDTVKDLQELFGGEIRKQGFEIGIVNFVGSKTPVYSIEYGKNLISNTSEEELDITIGVMPKGYDKLYTNNIIYSSKVEENPNILGRIVELEYPIRLIEYDEEGNAQEKEEGYIYYDNEEEAKKELERLAGLEFTVNYLDEPKVTFDTTFLDLSLVEECKNQEKVYLSIGDTVSTSIPKFNININTRIVEIEVDILADEITNVTLSNNPIGDLKPPTLNSISKEIVKLENKFQSKIEDKVLGLESNIEQTSHKILLEVKNTKEDLQSQITILDDGINTKVSRGTEFQTEFKQTSEDFNFNIGNDGTGVKINKDGLRIKNGAMELQDSAGNTVLKGTTSGDLLLRGNSIKIKDDLVTSAGEGMTLTRRGLNFTNINGGSVSFFMFDDEECLYISNSDVQNKRALYISGKAYISNLELAILTCNLITGTSISIKEGINCGTGGSFGKTIYTRGIDNQGYNINLNGGMLYGGEISSSGNTIRTGGGNITTGTGNITTTDISADDIACYSLDANYVYSEDKNVVVANGSTSSKMVKGLAITAEGSTGSMLQIQTRSGDVYGVSVSASDATLKKNIKQLDGEVNALEKNTEYKLKAIDTINKINHYSYDFIDKEKYGDGSECGYIAQELKEVNSAFAFALEQNNGEIIYSPNINAMIPYITKALKEQQKHIKSLEEKIIELEGR